MAKTYQAGAQVLYSTKDGGWKGYVEATVIGMKNDRVIIAWKGWTKNKTVKATSVSSVNCRIVGY